MYNDHNTLFWRDSWLGDFLLINLALREISFTESFKQASDYWDPIQGWKWEDLAGLLPTFIEDTLSTVLLRQNVDAQDRLCWNFTLNGIFSTKSAYSLSLQGIEDPPFGFWKEIWRLHVPQRIRSFIWLVHHERILINKERNLRGFTANSYCSLCHEEIKDLNHIFRTCPEANQFWRKMQGDAQVPGCLFSPFREWLMLNLSKNRWLGEEVDWKDKFAISLWWLWRWRNDGFLVIRLFQ